MDLLPRRVASELASRGEMELHPLGRRDRVEQGLLDDRMQESRRQTWTQELRVDQLLHAGLEEAAEQLLAVSVTQAGEKVSNSGIILMGHRVGLLQ